MKRTRRSTWTPPHDCTNDALSRVAYVANDLEPFLSKVSEKRKLNLLAYMEDHSFQWLFSRHPSQSDLVPDCSLIMEVVFGDTAWYRLPLSGSATLVGRPVQNVLMMYAPFFVTSAGDHSSMNPGL
jgi:hypothetical protein